MLGVARMGDLADRADIPSTVDMDVSQIMTFEARFPETGMVVRERGINRFTVDSTGGIDLMAEFHMLES